MTRPKLPCESMIPEVTWRNEAGQLRGRCIKCGFEGNIRVNGNLLYQHSRDRTTPVKAHMTGYEPLYLDERIPKLAKVCMECGVVVFDVDAHDDWHEQVVDDLNYLRAVKEDRNVAHEG